MEEEEKAFQCTKSSHEEMELNLEGEIARWMRTDARVRSIVRGVSVKANTLRNFWERMQGKCNFSCILLPFNPNALIHFPLYIGNYPTLAKIAKFLLALLPTSSAVERDF